MKKILIILAFVVSGCSSTSKPSNIGLKDKKLQVCPSTPNCVCSDNKVSDQDHFIRPFKMVGNGEESFIKIVTYLKENSSAKIESQSKNYIHATFRSALFSFIDDVEFHLRTEERVIAVRSASRMGYSDLGVNRKRIEKIRKFITP